MTIGDTTQFTVPYKKGPGELVVEYSTADFSDALPDREYYTARLLVKYDQNTGRVTVDHRASEQYQRFAALHEVLCSGKLNEQDIVKVLPGYHMLEGQYSNTCARIEAAMLNSFLAQNVSEGMSYNNAVLCLHFMRGLRRSMFEALLRYDLNPEKAETFRETMERVYFWCPYDLKPADRCSHPHPHAHH
jgi:hypothetical protein